MAIISMMLNGFSNVHFSRSLIAFLCCFLLCANTSAKPTILVMGDSLSAAYQMAPHNGWVNLLEIKLKENFPQAQVINSSIVGETTAGGLQRLPKQLEKYRPDIVIIELGGNDGLRGLPIPNIKANLNKMIEASLAQPSQVLLVGMRLPPNYGQGYTQEFANNYISLSKEHAIALVPFFLDKVALAPGMMLPDRIHPTAKAQVILLDNLWPHLEPLLAPYR